MNEKKEPEGPPPVKGKKSTHREGTRKVLPAPKAATKKKGGDDD